jgi:hypothetical protein
LYNIHSSLFKKDFEKLILNKIFEVLQDRKQFIKSNLCEEIQLLLIQISFLSSPNIIDQHLFQSYSSIIRDELIPEKLQFPIDFEKYRLGIEEINDLTKSFECFKENLIKIDKKIKEIQKRYQILVNGENNMEKKISIIIALVMSYNDFSEEGELLINLPLKNAMKYIIQNIEDAQCPLTNLQIQEIIENYLEEIINQVKLKRSICPENLDFFLDKQKKILKKVHDNFFLF